jgi:hypothetical protein
MKGASRSISAQRKHSRCIDALQRVLELNLNSLLPRRRASVRVRAAAAPEQQQPNGGGTAGGAPRAALKPVPRLPGQIPYLGILTKTSLSKVRDCGGVQGTRSWLTAGSNRPRRVSWVVPHARVQQACHSAASHLHRAPLKYPPHTHTNLRLLSLYPTRSGCTACAWQRSSLPG